MICYKKYVYQKIRQYRQDSTTLSMSRNKCLLEVPPSEQAHKGVLDIFLICGDVVGCVCSARWDLAGKVTFTLRPVCIGSFLLARPGIIIQILLAILA